MSPSPQSGPRQRLEGWLQRVDAGREELVLAAVALLSAGLTLATIVQRYALFTRLESLHNSRLLDSAQAWIDHGFWRLGGFLLFQRDYSGQMPTELYKSHVPFYVLPHYWALRWGGESGFWSVVGWIPILTAVVVATCLALIAWRASLDWFAAGRPDPVARGLSWVAGTSAFTVAFASEPVWSLTWNSFDGSLAMVLLLVAMALTVSRRGSSRGGWLPLAVLVLSALSCSRFGVFLGLALLAVRWLSSSGEGGVPVGVNGVWFRWPTIALVLAAGSVHQLWIQLAPRLFDFRLWGTAMLYRMGLTHWYKDEGQGTLPYQTPLSGFTFLWRQSENAIGELPTWMNSYHLLIWGLALVVFAVVVARRRVFAERPLLEILLVLPLLWTLLLNQSAAEHPDLVCILWLPAYVLGWAFAFAWLYRWLARRLRRVAALWLVGGLLFMHFLWQIQYFLRAYPRFH